MDNSKSNNQNKSNRYYIRIVDDTVSDNYFKYQNSNVIFGYVFVYLAVVMPIVGVVGILSNSAIAVMVALLIATIATVAMYQNGKKKRMLKLEQERGAAEDKRIAISKKEFSNLKELLGRIGNITMSSCDGFITKPRQMVGIQTVPLYGLASNPTFHKYTFIRTDCDLKYISSDDKKLVLKAFGCEKKRGVIWISQKNSAKWTMLSNFPVINFIDENGNKMCFGRSRYSSFYNHHELTIENGECVIHIKDKRPNYEKTASGGEGETDKEYEDEDEYYDDDI